MANVCIFILLIFSFLIIESKCNSNHMSSVRLQLGNWLIRRPNSWICTVWEAIGPVAISSKRGKRSVVSSGSGNSLWIHQNRELKRENSIWIEKDVNCAKRGERDTHWMNNFNKLHAVEMSNSDTGTISRLLYKRLRCCSFVLTTSTL